MYLRRQNGIVHAAIPVNCTADTNDLCLGGGYEHMKFGQVDVNRRANMSVGAPGLEFRFQVTGMKGQFNIHGGPFLIVEE